MSVDKERIEADLNESRHRLNDTLEALGQKLSPRDMAEDVVDMVRSETGRIARFAGHQVQQNPLPLALIAAGVAWLVISNRRGASESAAPRRLSDTSRNVSADDWKVERRWRSLDEVATKYPQLADESEDDYGIRVHQAYATALELEPEAGEDEHGFRARVKRTVDSIRHAATQAGSDIKKSMKGVTSRVSGAASEVSGSANRFYEESPLATGAIALALGALLGGAAPLTQSERTAFRGAAQRMRNAQNASRMQGDASQSVAAGLAH